MKPAPRFGLMMLAVLAGGLLGGCVIYQVVATPVKLAATGVVVAGETAGAVVTSTGKVATSAVKAVGRVGSTSLDSVAKLTETGMVTFVDAATGTVVRVPWREGLTLAGAGDAAKVALARRAVDVVRAGRVILSAASDRALTTTVASGDVIRVDG